MTVGAAGSPTVLFVDLQEGLIEASRTHAARAMRRSAAATIRIAGALGWRCLASSIPLGGAPPPLIEELAQAGTLLHRLERRTISALPANLAASDHLLLCGIATEAAILHTALAARRRGLTVEVLLDVCGGLSRRTEDAALRQLEAAGAVATSLASVATRLVGELTGPIAATVLAALQALVATEPDPD